VAHKRRRRSRSEADQLKPQPNPVLAGVARRMAEVIRLIQAGRWDAPTSAEEPEHGPDPEDDGGLAASGVRKVPPDISGSGSAALVEPEDDPVN
jgi:hypothetical protein